MCAGVLLSQSGGDEGKDTRQHPTTIVGRPGVYAYLCIFLLGIEKKHATAMVAMVMKRSSPPGGWSLAALGWARVGEAK